MSALPKLAIVGAGGLAREIHWLVREINALRPSYRFAGYLQSDRSKAGAHDSQNEILGDFAWLARHRQQVDVLALGVGTPSLRHQMVAELATFCPDWEWPALQHPTVRLDPDSTHLGRGTTLCAQVVGTVNLRLDDFALVNLQCTIGHETRIGAYSVVNPGVNLSGGVTVGQRVLIGTGAKILQYLRVGDGATVGAGAVVTRDVPDSTTVVGVPARAKG